MKLLILLCCFVLAVLPFIDAFKDRKILVSKLIGKTITLPQLQQIRKKIHDQAISDLRALAPAVKNNFIVHADQDLAKNHYPVKTAFDFMEYFRNGNRGHYEMKLAEHKTRIGYLVIGNIMDQEHNPASTKYLNEIINGIWMMMEESTWMAPGHMYLQKSTDPLPIPGHHAVDLIAGENAKFLGWVKLLMGDKFNHVTKIINQRIDYELRNRIFQCFLDNDDFFWEGFKGDHVTSNWNIWINGNILKAAIFALDDVALFNKVYNKTLYSADFFLDSYGEDGGCDEGPAYWRQAGGRLIEYMESVSELQPEATEYFKTNKLIKSIGDYSYKMLIDKTWFVNFADGQAKLTYPPTPIAKFGTLFNDDRMKQYSAYMLQFVSKANYVYQIMYDFNEFMNYVAIHKEIESFPQVAPVFDVVWMPDIQVFNARSKSATTNKFYIAGKAGTNHESHNHNDVGSFIMFQNGFPVLIDIGVGTYTAKTFGPHRYELFYMQSQYHNCPTINGIQQKEGNYAAHNVTFEEFANNDGVLFTADIAGAYPKEAHVTHWVRSIRFDKVKNSIQIDEKYQLASFVAAQKVHFITVPTVTITKNEQGLLLKSPDVHVQLEIDWKVFDYEVEDRSMEGDHHLTEVWGESVKRITLTTKAEHKELSGHFTFGIVEAK